MQSLNLLASKASPSKVVNCWKVRVRVGGGTKTYLITPAHVLLHLKNGKLQMSKFIGNDQTLKDQNWFISKNYDAHSKEPLQFDLAWAETSNDEDCQSSFFLDEKQTLPSETPFIKNAMLYFRQPYNREAVWLEKDSSLAAKSIVLYRSPGSPCEFIESLDVGFRGLSGAVAISISSQTLLGLFVRKAISIPLNEKHFGAPGKTQNTTATVNHTINEEEIIDMLKDMPPPFDTIYAAISMKTSRLENKLEELKLRVLQRHQLEEILQVANVRRGLFLPANIIQPLNNPRRTFATCRISSNWWRCNTCRCSSSNLSSSLLVLIDTAA